jgi:hypothetical protein
MIHTADRGALTAKARPGVRIVAACGAPRGARRGPTRITDTIGLRFLARHSPSSGDELRKARAVSRRGDAVVCLSPAARSMPPLDGRPDREASRVGRFAPRPPTPTRFFCALPLRYLSAAARRTSPQGGGRECVQAVKIATDEEKGAMTERDKDKHNEEQELRYWSNFLALWRVCGNARCRRAKTCRGRARACGKKNTKNIPPSVREFFVAFLAGKRYGVPFEEFREDMEFKPCTRDYFAWRNGAQGN